MAIQTHRDGLERTMIDRKKKKMYLNNRLSVSFLYVKIMFNMIFGFVATSMFTGYFPSWSAKARETLGKVAIAKFSFFLE